MKERAKMASTQQNSIALASEEPEKISSDVSTHGKTRIVYERWTTDSKMIKKNQKIEITYCIAYYEKWL